MPQARREWIGRPLRKPFPSNHGDTRLGADDGLGDAAPRGPRSGSAAALEVKDRARLRPGKNQLGALRLPCEVMGFAEGPMGEDEAHPLKS